MQHRIAAESTAALVVLALIILAFTSFPSFALLAPAYACEVLYSPPLERLEGADAVFAGTVTEIQGFAIEGSPNQHIVFFKVNRYWKSPDGKDYEKLVVLQPIGEGSCGYAFEENKRYLVYASHRPLYDNALFTGLGLAQTMEDAQEDLSLLGEGSVPTRQLSVEEQIDGISFQLMPSGRTEDAIGRLLLIIGAGGAIAGAAAFFTLMKLRKERTKE